MKVKVLSRNPNDYKRETKLDIHKVQRNYDPALHPLELPREYKRALNAVKLDRVFAKPFLGALQGHSDVVQSLMKHPTRLSVMVSGSCDGQIKLWNIATRKCIRTIQASNSVIRSMCPRRYEVPSTGEDEELQGNTIDPGVFFSVDDSSNIKMWRYEWNEDMGYEKDEPLNTVIANTVLGGIDAHYKKPLLMTSGERVDVWEETRSEPLVSYKWNIDTIYGVKFNPVETDVAVASGSDRSLILYDIRQKEPLRKVILALRTNAVCWNPMEGMHFTAANEDYDCYTFDMRKLSEPMVIHKDHVQAVIDLDYAPTGKEFVTGSYDKTVRIFSVNAVHSREVYSTKRMQKLTSVIWSLDNKYVISASDEMDIRVWKANASEKLGPKHARESTNFKYQEKLKEKFAHHPEISRIANHRHVPKAVYSARKELEIIKRSQTRKEKNRRLHSKPGTVPFIPPKKRQIVREDE